MKISIPQPCHENWSEMLPAEKERFCQSCQKCVTDFTLFSDDEILKILQKPNQCGRFSARQLDNLNRKLKEENQIRFPRIFRYSALIAGLGLSGSLVAQEKEKVEIVQTKASNSNQTEADSIRIISGFIKDANGFPMDSAKISFKNGNSVLSDLNGYFKIQFNDEIFENDNSIYVRIQDKENIITEEYVYLKNDNLSITCNGYITGLIPETIVYKKRTLSGKIFHTIAWPFRQIGKLF